ncbi:MAG: membrane integrity-associated transporter subunit PqiC [Thermodesulfovibrionales bacterium]
MRKFRHAFIAFLLVGICAACAMPQTKIYSLALKNEGLAAKTKTEASLDLVVHSPRYLSQPYIAYRTSPYQLDIARYSKWDSPPAEMVRESFRNALSAAALFKEVRASNFVPPAFYSLEIDLKRFERLDNGSGSFADLSFDLGLLSPDGKTLYRGSFEKKIKLGDRGFTSLAEALSRALAEGIDEAKAAIAGAFQGPI